MTLTAYLRSLADRFARRSATEDDLDEELRSHVELRADDLVRSGMGRAAAERQARVEFGGVSRFKDEAREQVAGHVLETVARDVKISLRQLRKTPSFAVAAILTLAVAIGANAVAFGALNGLVLRSLDVPRQESLYIVEHTSDNDAAESYPNYVDLRDRNRSFESLATYNLDFVWLRSGDRPERASAYQVSGNYFDVLGVQPYIGRLLHASDEHGPGSAPYLVLGYGYWHAHFHDDHGVLGRTIEVNRHPFTVIGVAPPGFNGTLQFFKTDVYFPIVQEDQVDAVSYLASRSARGPAMVGHLKTLVTPAQATADLNAIAADLAKVYPAENDKLSYRLARPTLGGDLVGRPIQAFLTALLLLAGLILLAACANLGSLFAARAADRSREVALRMALGAGRGRILRQLFTEAILVSLIGGAIGLWGSVLLLHGLSTWQPLAEFPFTLPVRPDAAVYGVAVGLSVASGFIFGAVPVRQVLRTDPYQVVKAGSTGAPGRRIGARDLLLVVQIAICAVLVTSSLVAVRGLARSLHADFGFDPANATLVETDLASAGYKPDAMAAMQRRMIDATAALPGVTFVGLVSNFPPLHLGWDNADVFADDATDFRPSKAVAEPLKYAISPEYFLAARTKLLLGRTFNWHDDLEAPRVAVVNQLFARKLFGTPSVALGKYFKLSTGTRVQIVGIVEDGKYTANIAENPQPAMFLSMLQSPSSESWLVVRSARDAGELPEEIRGALRTLDPGLPASIHSWTRDMEGALFAPRMASIALGVLGAMGAALAITGIFGMAAYSLSKRLRELGIRVALGAQRWQVLQAALGRALRLLAFGSAAGLVLGILASRVLAFIVYQATPRDPLVLAGVVLAMLFVGLVATWIPAQRALRLDPLILLRDE